ncbi:MAG: hypothetical protein U9R79_09680 [Armatimonadota bacterium]|nr:hypothetical protein [Armatimonadota bacterium]
MRRLGRSLDGEIGPEFDGVSGPHFSADGQRFAYFAGRNTAEDAKKWVVIVDGVPGPEFDAIRAVGPLPLSLADGHFVGTVFSADGQHVTYGGRIGPEKDGRWHMVRDGVLGPDFDDVSYPATSPDGKRFAYIAVQGRDHFVVLDGQRGPVARSGGADAPRPIGVALLFSPDSRHLAYTARFGKKWCVVFDGQPGREFAEIYPNGPSFLQDGSLQYMARNGDVIFRVTLAPE